MLTRSDLHGYQRRAVVWAKRRKNCAMWMDLGLGKTITALTVANELSNGFEVDSILIIAPLRVANSVWHKEIEKWSHIDLTYSVCTGTKDERQIALYKKADVHIINRENVPWLIDLYKDNWPWDMVIIDEASSFKSHVAVGFLKMADVLQQIDILIELTATPASNGLIDLWPQLYLLDKGHRLGKNITAYRDRFFTYNSRSRKYVLRKGADDIIHDRIKDIVLTLKAEDYLDLPEKITTNISVRLTKTLETKYKHLKNDFVTELEKNELTVESAAACSIKLLQFCNGAAYIDLSGKYETIHDLKLTALEELVEQNPNENLLVAYNFKTDLIRLQAKFPKAVVMDKKGKCLKAWDAGKIKMLLAHPASSGHGLNLQKGGNTIVWFGLNWSLELYQQFNGRLYRQGQYKPVTIVHIVCEDCIDETVMEVIADKAMTQDKLLNYLKLNY